MFRAISSETDPSCYLFPHQHLESLHPALLQRTVGLLWLSSPTYVHVSHLTSTQGGIVEQMVLRELAYNVEKSQTRESHANLDPRWIKD